jgi:hypothetical protein
MNSPPWVVTGVPTATPGTPPVVPIGCPDGLNAAINLPQRDSRTSVSIAVPVLDKRKDKSKDVRRFGINIGKAQIGIRCGIIAEEYPTGGSGGGRGGRNGPQFRSGLDRKGLDRGIV